MSDRKETGCYYGAGQCLESVAAMELNMPDGKMPSLIALYEGIGQDGITDNYQIMEAHNFFPGAILQIGLELPKFNRDGLLELGNGTLDAYIIQLAKRYQSIPGKIFLRIGYEFDGEWNSYDPDLYIRAYQRIVDIFRDERVMNVEFVWNSYICDDKNIFLWYPGDEYIDWFSFNTVTAKFNCGWFVKQAQLHHKPVIIGEASYAIVKEDLTFQDWCQQFFEMIYKYNIQGFQYINWEWSVYPRILNWHTWKNGRYTDTPVYINKMNQIIDQYSFNMRGAESASPIRIIIDCARRMKETTEVMPWEKALDHVAMRKEDNYNADSITCVYEGWLPYWLTVGKEGVITLYNHIYEGDGYIFFHATRKDGQNGTVYVNKQGYALTNQLHSMVKIPVQIIPEETFDIRFQEGVLIDHIGLQGIEAGLPSPSGLERNIQRLQWHPVEDAAGYNIYINYQLYQVTKNPYFLFDHCSEGDIISISTFYNKLGESNSAYYII